MRFSIIVILSIIRDSEEAAVSFYEDSSYRGDVLSCVDGIVKRHFDSERQVAILNQGSKDFAMGMKNTVQLLIANTSMMLDKIFRLSETKQAVIFLDGDFDRDLNILMSLGSFHPSSRFLIVCNIVDNGLSTKNYLIKVVRYLNENKRWVVAIAVRSIGENDNDDLLLYGYTKTVYGNCENPEILSFGICKSDDNVDRLFSPTINYNQCPLRLATFDWPPFTRFVIENGRKKSIGIESELVNFIIERLNASASFLEAAPSRIRTIIGNHEADMGYGQMSLFDPEKYSHTKSYSSVQGLILLPKFASAFRSPSNNLMPLESTVWTALALVVIFVIILQRVLPAFRIISVLETLAVFVGLGTNARPIRFSQRIYFISMVIFGYVITQAYLANLTMIFTKAIDYEAIKSIEDLDKSTLPLAGSATVAKFFENKYPRLFREFQVMNLSWFKDNLQDLKQGKGGVPTYVEVSKYVNYNHWKLTTTVPEVITWSPIAIIVPNFNIILPTCDSIITFIVEAGLMEYWAIFLMNQTLQANDPTVQTNDDNGGSMAIQQFLTIFSLLGIAMSFSTVVFIIELLVAFWQKKKEEANYCQEMRLD